MADRGTTAVEQSALEPETKKCPMCAETILAEAKVCRFCGAHFDVSVQGYCGQCHRVTALDDAGTCEHCHGEVIDRRFVSELAAGPPPAAAPAGAVTGSSVGAVTGSSVGPVTGSSVGAVTGSSVGAVTGTSVVAQPTPAPTPTPTPRGALRAGYIGNRRQDLAEALLAVGGLSCLLTTVLGWAGTEFFLLGLKPGIAEARPGWWFFLGPLVALSVGSAQLRRRGVWMRRPYGDLKSRYGIRRLYKLEHARLRVVIAALLWLGTLVLAIAMIGVVSHDGYDVKPGSYLLVVAAIVGLVGSVLITPGSDNRVVEIDDEGNLFA